MSKENLIWSGIVVVLVVLVAVLVVDGKNEISKLDKCKSLRIRALTEKFFSWEGILELNQKGEYQPKCL